MPSTPARLRRRKISSATRSPRLSPKTCLSGGVAVFPDRERGEQVGNVDTFGAVEQAVDQRQADDLRIGSCRYGAVKAFGTRGELWIDLRPYRTSSRRHFDTIAAASDRHAFAQAGCKCSDFRFVGLLSAERQ